MEYVQILQLVLIDLGGGDGDPNHEYLRHVLPLIMWVIIYMSSRSLVDREHSGRDQWLRWAILFAIATQGLLLISQIHFGAVHSLQTGANTRSVYSQIIVPLSLGWLALNYLILGLAMERFVGLTLNKRQLCKRLCGAALAIVLVSCIVTLHWVHTNDGGGSAALFYGSSGYVLLVCVCLLVVSFSVVRIFTLRSYSHASRNAWVPFSLYALAYLLLLISVRFEGLYEGLWMLTISGNLLVWATPWFGYVYWRDLLDEKQALTLRTHQAERLDVVGRLAAGVAHDFNNHLQAILGFAEIGHANSKSDPKHQGHYDSIMESVERARVLVKQLMRFKSDAPLSKIENVSLLKVVQDLSLMLNGIIGSNITIINHLDPEAHVVKAERGMLEQVLINVAVNAKDAMAHGGTITLKCHPLSKANSNYKQPMIRLTVTDTGKGLSEEDRLRVFEPFFTTKGREQGNGLGLSSSLVAIRSMGGDMTIRSKLYRGTTLYIDLPAANNQAAIQPVAVQNQHDIMSLKGNERILVAEDEPGLRHIVSMQLTQAGYDVMLARDGEHAIELLESTKVKVDLLMLDVMMPRKDGYTTFVQAQQLVPDIPVVFVTANIDYKTQSVSGQPHLSKPFRREAMLRVVRQTLDKQATVT